MRDSLLSLGLAAVLCGSTVACDELTGGQTADGHLAIFDDARGLAPGARVYIAGVRVGRVKQVSFKEGKAHVLFAIETNANVPIYSDACASISAFSYADEAHLAIEQGNEAAGPLTGEAEIKCVKSGASAANAEQAVAEMMKILQAANDGKGTIARLLHDEALAKKVTEFFDGAPAVGSAVVEPVAPVEPAPATSATGEPVAVEPAPPRVAPVPKGKAVFEDR